MALAKRMSSACRLLSTYTTDARHIGMQLHGNDSAKRHKSRQTASSYPMEVRPHWTTRAPRWNIAGTHACDSSEIQILSLPRLTDHSA